MVMSVRGIERLLEQWEMGVKDVHRRVILAPTPRERALRQAQEMATPSGCWPKDGPPRRWQRCWNGTRTPSEDGPPPSVRVGQRP